MDRIRGHADHMDLDGIADPASKGVGERSTVLSCCSLVEPPTVPYGDPPSFRFVPQVGVGSVPESVCILKQPALYWIKVGRHDRE
jgi:hypothetical protein